MLTLDKSAEEGTPTVDESIQVQPTEKTSCDQQAAETRSCMKSGKVRCGLKVRFV